jgi:hypothetical protein
MSHRELFRRFDAHFSSLIKEWITLKETRCMSDTDSNGGCIEHGDIQRERTLWLNGKSGGRDLKPEFTHFLCSHNWSRVGCLDISVASLTMADGKCGYFLGILPSCQFRRHVWSSCMVRLLQLSVCILTSLIAFGYLRGRSVLQMNKLLQIFQLIFIWMGSVGLWW